MASTTTTVAGASDPSRALRPENDRATSRHWLRMYRSVHASPASASVLNHCHSGFSCEIASAAPTSATPSQPTSPRTLLSIIALPAPAFHVDGLGGQEQTECDETEVIDDVVTVHDAPGEIAEVLGDRKTLDDALRQRAAAVVSEPADDPQQEKCSEGEEPRHDLVFRDARDEESERDERAAHQEQTDVPGRDRTPLGIPVDEEDADV